MNIAKKSGSRTDPGGTHALTPAFENLFIMT